MFHSLHTLKEFLFLNASVWSFPEQLVPFHAAAHKAYRRVIVFYRASTTRLILECLIRSVKCDCHVFSVFFSFPVIISPTQTAVAGDDDAGQGICKFMQNNTLLNYAICFSNILFDAPTVLF